MLRIDHSWTLQDDQGEHSLEVAIPGSAYTALQAAGQLPDPFYRRQELDVQWVAERDWTFRTEFSVEPAMLEEEHLELLCEGLDTFATVTLNGEVIAETRNMFRGYALPLAREQLRESNTLEVKISSPLEYMAAKTAEKDRREPIETDHTPRGRPYIRKMACAFGWDWGPVLPSSGIWKPISLRAWSQARVAGVHYRQEHREGSVTLRAELELDGSPDAVLAGTFCLDDPDGKRVAEAPLEVAGLEGRGVLTVEHPRLWWPVDMGEQPLYRVSVILHDGSGEELDRDEKRLGLRTIDLIRENDDIGQSFFFRVNGRDIFARGADWIPAEADPAMITTEQVRARLEDAREGHMNMIRVWGGGMYESDFFYDTCDELGLLVWQDFCFACCAYPFEEEWFKNEITLEAEDNIRRLRHHASLALWNGNNELEMNSVGNGYNQTSWADYTPVFDELLPGLIERLNPEADYWPSSPHTPLEDRTDVNDDRSGNCHFWAVWHGRMPFTWFRGRLPRFCSEFGFESFPEPASVETFCAKGDFNVNSRVMEHHQRCAAGNQKIVEYFFQWFPMARDFPAFLWMSQLSQALAVQYAVEHWRRHQPRCGGALFWQLNDCWPVASWSAIDYHGRRKALYSVMKRSFAPQALSIEEDAERGTFQLFSHDDAQDGGGSVAWQLTDTAGNIIEQGSVETVPGAKAARLLKISSEPETVLWAQWLRDGQTIAEAATPLLPYKYLSLPDPELEVVRNWEGESLSVHIEAKAPAYYVFLDQHGFGGTSDNFFHLPQGAKKNVTCHPRIDPAEAALPEVKSLWNLFDA